MRKVTWVVDLFNLNFSKLEMLSVHFFKHGTSNSSSY